MLKKLVKHGNTFAITIDKKMLAEANLRNDAKFDVHVVPGVGLIIQSVEEIDRKRTKKEFDEISEEYDQLFKRLSKR